MFASIMSRDRAQTRRVNETAKAVLDAEVSHQNALNLVSFDGLLRPLADYSTALFIQSYAMF